MTVLNAENKWPKNNNTSGGGGGDGMNITRGELNAKCEAIETRMDARLQQIETVFLHTSSQNEELKKEFRQAKWWAIGTAIAMIAIIVAVVSLISSWQQSYLATYSTKIDSIETKLNAIQEHLFKFH